MNALEGERYFQLALAAEQVSKYSDALRYYNQAIVCDKNKSLYYQHRSAVNLKQECYNDALEDAITANALNPKNGNALIQLIECHLVMGNYNLARYVQKSSKKLNLQLRDTASLMTRINEVEKEEEKAADLLAKNDLDAALKTANALVNHCPANVRAMAIQVECLLRLNSVEEAEDIYYEYLCSEEHLSEVKYLRALINYYRNELDTAFSLCKSIISSDPDFKKAVQLFKLIKSYKDVLANGKQKFGEGDYAAAGQIYNQGLEIDPSNKKAMVPLYVNKAIICVKNKSYVDAITFCDLALKIDPNNLKALVNKAEGHSNSGDCSTAIRLYTKAYDIRNDQNILKKIEELKAKGANGEDNEEAKKDYDVNKFFEKYKTEDKQETKKENAENEQKKKAEDENANMEKRLVELKKTLESMKKMKPHQVLNVTEDANESQIRKGYANCVKKYHPDHVNKFPLLKEVCEEIFKLVQKAKRFMDNKNKK